MVQEVVIDTRVVLGGHPVSIFVLYVALFSVIKLEQLGHIGWFGCLRT